MDHVELALAEFATHHDPTPLHDCLDGIFNRAQGIRWSWSETPEPEVWSERERQVARFGLTLGPRREVRSWPFEGVARSLARHQRFVEIEAPHPFMESEIRLLADHVAGLDEPGWTSRPCCRLDRVVCVDGVEIWDLGQFALEAIRWMVEPTPVNVGVGPNPCTKAIQALAPLEAFWVIHRQRIFEEDVTALALAPEAMDPPGLRLAQPFLRLLGDDPSSTRWRTRATSLTCGDFGGPISRLCEGETAEWLSHSRSSDETVLSFMWACTAESPTLFA